MNELNKILCCKFMFLFSGSLNPESTNTVVQSLLLLLANTFWASPGFSMHFLLLPLAALDFFGNGNLRARTEHLGYCTFLLTSFFHGTQNKKPAKES